VNLTAVVVSSVCLNASKHTNVRTNEHKRCRYRRYKEPIRELHVLINQSINAES